MNIAHLVIVHLLDFATVKPTVSTRTIFTLSLNVSVPLDATRMVNAVALALGLFALTMSQRYNVSWHPARRLVLDVTKRLLHVLMTTVEVAMPTLSMKLGFGFATLLLLPLLLVHRLMIVDRKSTAREANA